MDQKLAYLWKIIKEDDINIEFDDILNTDERGLGLYFNDFRTGPVILLDYTLKQNTRQLRCVLAEEVGHHICGVISNLITINDDYIQKIIRSRDENRALRWATTVLIPDLELCKAIDKGYRDCYELAEYFCVTPGFMVAKLQFLKKCFRKNGLRVRGRDILHLQFVSEACF